MDLGILTGVIGIVITILIYLQQTLYKNQSKRKNVSLVLEEKQCYNLLNEDARELKIEIRHKDKLLENPIILFKGKLTNNGIKDVDDRNVKKPLNLKIDDKYTIIEGILLARPKDCNCKLNLSDSNNVEIVWDLLKSGEIIEFQLILEVVDSFKSSTLDENYFYKSLLTECRITDLSKRDIKKIEPQRQIKRAKFFIVAYSFILLIGIFFLFDTYYFENKMFSTYDQTFELTEKHSNKKSDVRIRSNDVNLLTIKNTNNEKRTMKIEDFNKNYSISAIKDNIQSTSSIVLNTIYSIFCILMSLLFIPLSIYRIKSKRLEERIENFDPTKDKS